jgi:hypothetical protein
VTPLLLLALFACAQSSPEELSDKAGAWFRGPSQLDGRRTVTAFYLLPQAEPDAVDVSGFAAGVDVELKRNKTGGSLVLAASGFGRTIDTKHSDFQPNGKPGRRDVVAFSGGPGLALRQRLFQLGSGKVTVTPDVSVGWTPITFSRVGYLKLEPNGRDYEHVTTEGGWAPMTGYGSAGVSVSVGRRLAVGVQARRYQELGGNGLSMNALGLTGTYVLSSNH